MRAGRNLGTVVAAAAALLLLALPAQAQTYRCTEQGKITFSDRPCSAGAERMPERTPQPPAQKPAADPRSTWNPAEHGGVTYDAHLRQEAQSKLVQCIVDQYNAGLLGQKTRPSREARAADMTKAQQDCRARFPEGIYKPPPEPKQASPELDAFLAAIKSRNAAQVKSLLDAGVSPSSTFTFPDPASKALRAPALIFSIHNSVDDVTLLLIERGSDVAARNHYGNTALHAAAERGRIKVIGVLLDRGLDIAARSNGDATPLHSAITSIQPEAVKYLLARGAPVDAQAQRGGTPLMTAIRANANNERLTIIVQLLQSGADPNLPDPSGDYPLHAAIQGRGQGPMMEVIKLLIQADAKLDSRNKAGETSVTLAERLGRRDVVALLQSASARGGRR